MWPSLASSQINASEYIAFHKYRAPFITYSNHLFQVNFTCKLFLKGQCQEKWAPDRHTDIRTEPILLT
jgi:hypothetical protein